MIRSATLIASLTLAGNLSAKDPHADGAGDDVLPELKGLVASDDLPGASIAEGTRLRVAADHEKQGITSPTALSFDEKGDVYITETHRFRFGVDDNRGRLYGLIDDLASRTVEDRRKMNEKWKDKVSIESLTERSETVRKLSGQGDDGRFSESTIFADGFNDQLDGTIAGILAYEDTVFLANIPKIYALKDADGDGRSDGRTVIEDGFGVRISFSGHDLNGFALGPDGRLYGTIGDRGFNVETAEGIHYEYPNEGAIFRFDPDGSNFEVIHTGLRNPKEIAFDDHGNAFTVDNNSDQQDEARVVYIVDGADSGWRMERQTLFTFFKQIGLDEPPVRPWMDERMWATANPDQPAWMLPPAANFTTGPSGLTYHPGTGFLESELGRFLVCDYRGSGSRSGVLSFEMVPSGAGMRLASSHTLAWGIGATDIDFSWDGRVFITDFVQGWISHEDGRLLELSATEPHRAEEAAETARLIAAGFASRPPAELGELLSHPDMRVRLRAQFALTRAPAGLGVLEKTARDGEGLAQLHGIWGLGIVARRGSAAMPGDDVETEPRTLNRLRERAARSLLPLLDHGNAEVRAQTIRVLGDSGLPAKRISFTPLLEDSSARVRMFAAIAAGKTRSLGALPYIWKMIEVNDDQDPYLRHAGVHAMELMADPMQLVPLRDHESPSVRLAAAIVLGRKDHDRIAEFLADADPRVADEAIRMIHDRSIEDARPAVAALLEKDAKRTPMMWRRLLHSAYRLGDATNLERVTAFALDPEKPAGSRREAMRLLSLWATPHVVDQSVGGYAPLPERDADPVRAFLQEKVTALMSVEPAMLEAGLAVIEANRLDLAAVSAADLEKLVFAEDVPVAARRSALDLLLDKQPAEVDALLLRVAGSDADMLAVEGLTQLVRRKSPQASAALASAFGSERAGLRQRAWRLARGQSDPAIIARFVDALAAAEKDGGIAADALEMIEEARKRTEPPIVAALAKYDAAMKSSSDPLAPWLTSLNGGDPEKGAVIFQSHPYGQCSRCHEGGHGQAGPVLDAVALRGDRRFLLESLVAPAAKVAPGFGLVAATMKDGSSVGGILLEESPESVVLDVAGERKTLARADIASLSEPVSSMPPMGALIEARELRDLVAWLSERKGEEP